MKKALLILGLFAGTLIATDASAFSAGNNSTATVHFSPKKDIKKKKKKSCCTKPKAAASTDTKKCGTGHSCCKKKADAPATGTN